MNIETTDNEILSELQSISARVNGLTPRSVLAVAKNPKSCLHKYFTWDDTEAAARYREIQAEGLIRRVKVTISKSPTEIFHVRAFVNVKDIEKDGAINLGSRGRFVPILTALSNKETKEQILSTAKRELVAFRSKYSALTELGAIIKAIDQLI